MERPKRERRIELGGVQVAASAFAAISSAFLLSSLGVAGTVVGAAIASVVATVGSALYAHVFRRTGDHLRGMREAAAADQQQTAAQAPTMLLPVLGPSVPAEPEPAGGRGRTWLVRSLVAAVGVFVIAMAAITVIETTTGRSFASVFGHGGNAPTVTQPWQGGGSPHHSTPAPATPSPSDSTTGTPAQGDGQTPSQPGRDSGSPTSGPSGRPSVSPTPTVTQQPTDSGTPTAPPSATATAAPQTTAPATPATG